MGRSKFYNMMYYIHPGLLASPLHILGHVLIMILINKYKSYIKIISLETDIQIRIQ